MSDRAVSTVVSYVLTLGIVVLLLTTLTGVFGPLVTGQQDDAVRSTLEVFGNDIAGDLESADRLAQRLNGTDGAVEIQTRLPDRVGGETYEIVVSGNEIELRSPSYETTIVVSVNTEIDIEESGTLDGGTLAITYDPDANRLEVEND